MPLIVTVEVDPHPQSKGKKKVLAKIEISRYREISPHEIKGREGFYKYAVKEIGDGFGARASEEYVVHTPNDSFHPLVIKALAKWWREKLSRGIWQIAYWFKGGSE